VVLVHNAAPGAPDNVGGALDADEVAERAARVVETAFGPAHTLNHQDERPEEVRHQLAEVGHLAKILLVARLGPRRPTMFAGSQVLCIGARREEPARFEACALQHRLGAARKRVMVPLAVADPLVMLARRERDDEAELDGAALMNSSEWKAGARSKRARTGVWPCERASRRTRERKLMQSSIVCVLPEAT